MIAAAAPQIADPLVRNLGTIGGSLTHCDPSGDLGAVMLAANARVVLKSKDARARGPGHRVPGRARSSPRSSRTRSSRPSRLTSPTGSYGGTYLKLERKIGDYATVAVATRLLMDDGSIGSAGIGLTCVGLTNIKATDAEDALAGQAPSRGALRRGGPPGGRGIEPRDRRARQRDVQAAHGRGVRPARPHDRPPRWPAPPELRRTRGRDRWKSRSPSTAPPRPSTSNRGSSSCT